MEGCRGGACSVAGRRSLTLLDHMSALDPGRDSLTGLTLDEILAVQKRSVSAAPPPAPAPDQAQVQSPTPAQLSRTLLDIIRDEEPHGGLFGHKDKKSWKAFRDRLRLKRAGAAWTSSVPIPASDIPIQSNNSSIYNNNAARSNFYNSRSLMSRRNSVRFTTVSNINNAGDSDDSSYIPTSRPTMVRRTSTRYGAIGPSDDEVNIAAVGDAPPSRSFRPQMTRHNSSRVPCPDAEPTQFSDDEEEPAREGSRRLSVALAEERALSAREAVAAQEAAEAEAAAQAAAEAEAAAAQEGEESDETPNPGGAGATEAQPVRMSLMDLLEETDRELGVVGSRYTVGEEEENAEEEEEEEEEDGGGGGVEHTCCVCMVRHKGAAFIPCGHTFCRLCSRELWVQRGHCPLCNGFILEILDIF